MTAAVLAVIFVRYGYADPVAEAYRATLGQEDFPPAYRAQSYLAPSFCYDLNRLESKVKTFREIFTKSDTSP